MPSDSARQDRDLVLPPATYAYVLDETKGAVKVHVGPTVTSPSGNEQLVIWTGKKFANVGFDQAIQPFIRASESQYVVLSDPAGQDPERFPDGGTATAAIDLDAGKKRVIQGPLMFALWPGQSAEVIDGHRLSYNEYLVVQVTNPNAAQENIKKTIAAPQTGEGETPVDVIEGRAFTMGERMVIKGTEVSYYVPPTGIEVLPEETLVAEVSNKARRPGFYVREAASLEQLEYAVLIDEDGTKRYVRGPAVVFPEPTEMFVTEKGERKFRALELNPQSGLYIKVVASYQNDYERTLKTWRGDGFVDVKHGERLLEGDELFITGSDQPIYFPRTEHSVIHYGVQRKHHAVAVPTGEGRYVLDRTRGEVNLVTGPRMFLPDPRTEVVVRRVLDDRTVTMLYPGNREAQAVNAAWRTEQDALEEKFLPAADAGTVEAGSLSRSYTQALAATSTSGPIAGEHMRRGTEYTPPRTITLDTKYQGAVRTSVWPGYAVLVMDPTGSRRVERGPVDLLLKYHETLMAFTLSTGRPKGTGPKQREVYLRTINNAVGDQVTVETRDLVPVTLELSLRVNFEGETQEEMLKWFEIEDYISLLTEHCRSRLRNVAKQFDIQTFNNQAIDIIRDTLLGEATEAVPRPGRAFAENGMRLYDVEVLGVDIQHPNVAQLLAGATMRALEGAIEVSEAEERAGRAARLESIRRERIEDEELTAVRLAKRDEDDLKRRAELALAAVLAAIEEADGGARLREAARLQERLDADQERELTQALDAVEIARASAETEHYKERMAATNEQLIQALNVFGDRLVTTQLLEAIGPAASVAGMATVDFAHQIFRGTALEGVFETLSERPLANGRSKEKQQTLG